MSSRPLSFGLVAAVLVSVAAALPHPGPLASVSGGASPAAAYAPSNGCRVLPRFDAGGTQVLDRVPAAGNEVALTFDMNGDPNRTFDVLDVLIEERVCATIFLNGRSASTAYGERVMEIIAENPDIFEVGNHTMNHCDLVTGEGDAPCPGVPPTAEFIRQELWQAADVIRAGTGLEPLPYWRPPFGAYDRHAVQAAASAGYTKLWHWSIDTRDWVRPTLGGRSTGEIVDHVLANVAPGSVVLMHLDGWNTADALRILIVELRARGYLLTSLSDLAIGEPLPPPPSGDPFYDIAGSTFDGDIAWLAETGITGGCAEYFFCPTQPVTREQMASFLVRALGLWQTGGIDFFVDDEGSVHEQDINRLAYAGIAAGCDDGRFCPGRAVSRAEMASFLVRALELWQTGGIDFFVDDEDSVHEQDINRLAHSGITAGCTDTRFCPSVPIRRDEMAAFLHRAFGP